MAAFRRLTRNLFERMSGWRQSSIADDASRIDICNDQRFLRIYEACRPFTMTSIERAYALYNAVRYVIYGQIPGDLVECGVWKGGSAMLMALTLTEFGDDDRDIYLYDTFSGMTEPGPNDLLYSGEDAQRLLAPAPKDSHLWAVAALEEVQLNLARTGYKASRVHYVVGDVRETLRSTLPERVAVLRLDTDWYESTLVELQYLYPILSDGGVLIMDDYGHWRGARKAIDDYFATTPAVLLHRIDYTGRELVKCERKPTYKDMN